MKLWHLFLICWACQVRVCSLGASVSGLKWVTFIRSCENNLTKQTKKEQKINTGHFDHPEHILNLTLYTWTVVNSDFSLKIVFAVGLAVKCLKNCSWSTLQTLHQHLKRTNHRKKAEDHFCDEKRGYDYSVYVSTRRKVTMSSKQTLPLQKWQSMSADRTNLQRSERLWRQFRWRRLWWVWDFSFLCFVYFLF